MNRFYIKEKLPSLNDYIAKCRANKYQGAKYKRSVDESIEWAIKEALITGALKPVTKPCTVHFEWHEKTRKRDCDNIASAKKFILDAMQKQGIIVNDNQRYIKGFSDSFIKSDSNYVVVTLKECEE